LALWATRLLSSRTLVHDGIRGHGTRICVLDTEAVPLETA
jgi:hypothetical protein